MQARAPAIEHHERRASTQEHGARATAAVIEPAVHGKLKNLVAIKAEPAEAPAADRSAGGHVRRGLLPIKLEQVLFGNTVPREMDDDSTDDECSIPPPPQKCCTDHLKNRSAITFCHDLILGRALGFSLSR